MLYGIAGILLGGLLVLLISWTIFREFIHDCLGTHGGSWEQWKHYRNPGFGESLLFFLSGCIFCALAILLIIGSLGIVAKP